MADTVTMKESEKKSSLICKAAVFLCFKVDAYESEVLPALCKETHGKKAY